VTVSLTKEQQLVVEKALIEYQKLKETQLRNKEMMDGKKFNFGTLVVKKNSTVADGLFGHSKIGKIGIVVGHYDLDRNVSSEAQDMYRIHWSKKSPYQGEDVNNLELYNGECPIELKNVTWNNLYVDFVIKGGSL